jgi:hypothetical protein
MMEAHFDLRDFRARLCGPGGPPVELDRLAHALAGAALLHGADAELEEYDANLEILRERLVQLAQADGFAHQSSFAAYLVAAYATEWVPSGLATFRRTPLGREGLERAMADAGVDPTRVEALLGRGSEPETADAGGSTEAEVGAVELDANRLAGLAERTLTRPEHVQALRRAARSPRDTARMATAARWVGRIRDGLSGLPADLRPERTVAALALWDRPLRRRLLEGRALEWPLDRLLAVEARLADGQLPPSADEGSPDTEDLPGSDDRDGGDPDGIHMSDEEDGIQISEAPEGLEGAPVETRASTGRLLGMVGRTLDLGLEAPSAEDVEARLAEVVAACEGRLPVERDPWSRRVGVVALMVAHQTGDAFERSRPDEREWLWVRACHLAGRTPDPSECRQRAADLVTELLGAYLTTL